MAYPEFDESRLQFTGGETQPPAVFTAERQHSLETLPPVKSDGLAETLRQRGEDLAAARNQGGATIFLGDTQLILAGVARHLVDLMAHGLLTHLALGPEAAFFDWQFALTGQVATPPQTLNGDLCRTELHDRFRQCLVDAVGEGLGWGESLGKQLLDEQAPFASESLLAQGFHWGVPVTVHAGMGCELFRALPDFAPESIATVAHRDFLILSNSVENLVQSSVYQFGETAWCVHAFAAALGLARNVAAANGRTIDDFTTVCFAENTEGTGQGTRPHVHVAALAPRGRGHVVDAPTQVAVLALRLGALRSAGWNV